MRRAFDVMLWSLLALVTAISLTVFLLGAVVLIVYLLSLLVP